MKKLSFFALAMTGMLFAACADKDVIAEDNGQGELRPDGYMSVNINLPTTPITRAANDNFDDGKADEYKVTDCALLLFQVAKDGSEEDATLIGAQAILLPFDDTTPDVDNDNITTSYQATAKVEGLEAGNDLYALAILNYKNVMSIDNDGLPKFTGASSPIAKKTKFSDIRMMTVEALKADMTTRGGSQNYFFMTNALFSKKPGSGAATAPVASDVFQLAKMDREKIKETAEDAKKDPAGEIIVERGVAKATLTISPSATAIGNLTTTENGTVKETTLEIDVANIKWTIDNMEPKSFVIRNPGDNSYVGFSSGRFSPSYYRFVGNASVNTSASFTTQNPDPDHNHGITEPAYRTYWCIDPQYDDDNMTGEGEKNSVGMLPYYDDQKNLIGALDYVKADGDTPLYCYENTFDVKHQSYRNTTRAIIEVPLKNAAPFWTINGGSEIFSTQSAATSYVAASVVNNTDVIETFEKGLKDENGTKWDINAGSFAIEYNYDSTTGRLKVTKIDITQTVKDEINKTFKNDFQTRINNLFDADFITTLNKKYVVREYRLGKVYYAARFKHFAGKDDNATSALSDLAPWNTWEPENKKPSGGSTDAAYPDLKPENYLGRYGMVRNNWYDVEVTEFLKLGYPVDPSTQVENEDFDEPDTPDDNIEEYISAKIHVLSWAKRMQQWGF